MLKKVVFWCIAYRKSKIMWFFKYFLENLDKIMTYTNYKKWLILVLILCTKWMIFSKKELFSLVGVVYNLKKYWNK